MDMDTQLKQLLGIWLNDDDASEEILKTLLKRLHEDEPFKQAFADELIMQGKLRAVQAAEPRWLKLNDRLGMTGGSESDGDDFELDLMKRASQVLSEKSRARSRQRTRRWSVALAAAVGVALIGLGISFLLPEKDSTGIAPAAPGTESRKLQRDDDTEFVALMSRTAEAVWENDEIFRPGANLASRVLRLHSGLAQIDFFGGAHLIIQGPAEVAILSDRKVFLKSGRASCYVSELGKGFQVATTNGEIFDLGTSFAIKASEAGPAEVHVIEGSVSILDQIVESNNARLIVDGALNSIPFAPEQFPRPNEFALREQERDNRRLRNWRSQADRISADEDVLLHYTMEGQNRTGPELINRASAQTPDRATNGTILGTSWAEGRWMEKSGIRFSNEEDRLLAKLPGVYKEVTFLVWAKVDALTQPRTAFILAHGPARWSKNGSISEDEFAIATKRRDLSEIAIVRWTALETTGAMHLNLGFHKNKQRSQLNWMHLHSQPNIITSSRWGKWGCYGVTYDAGTERVTHYFNGEKTGTNRIEHPEPLILDFLEIGNLSTPHDAIAPETQFRFYGIMDEIIVARRVFSAEEMKEICKNGMP